MGLELSQVELTIRTNRVLPHRPQTGVLNIFGFQTRIWTSCGSAPRGEFSFGHTTPVPRVDVDQDCARSSPAGCHLRRDSPFFPLPPLDGGRGGACNIQWRPGRPVRPMHLAVGTARKFEKRAGHRSVWPRRWLAHPFQELPSDPYEVHTKYSCLGCWQDSSFTGWNETWSGRVDDSPVYDFTPGAKQLMPS